MCEKIDFQDHFFLKKRGKMVPEPLLTKVEMSQTWSKWWFSFLFPTSDIHKYKVPSKYTKKISSIALKLGLGCHVLEAIWRVYAYSTIGSRFFINLDPPSTWRFLNINTCPHIVSDGFKIFKYP